MGIFRCRFFYLNFSKVFMRYQKTLEKLSSRQKTSEKLLQRQKTSEKLTIKTKSRFKFLKRLFCKTYYPYIVLMIFMVWSIQVQGHVCLFDYNKVFMRIDPGFCTYTNNVLAFRYFRCAYAMCFNLAGSYSINC